MNNLVVIGGRTLSNAEIVAALESSEGILVEAAAALGIRRHELEDAIDRDAFLQRVYMDLSYGLIDIAQKNVFKAVKDGNYAASIFILQTLGKEKGYSTKTELTLKKTEISFDDMSIEELKAYIGEKGRELGLDIRSGNETQMLPAA